MVLRLKQFYTGMQQISVMTLLTSLLKSFQLMIASYIEIFYFRSKSLQVINRAMKCF